MKYALHGYPLMLKLNIIIGPTVPKTDTMAGEMKPAQIQEHLDKTTIALIGKYNL